MDTGIRKTEWLPWIIASISYFSQFFGEIPEIAEIPGFAGHPCSSSKTCRN